MSSKMEEKKRLMRRKIVDTTIGQIRQKGYDQVTMEGIARSCHITKRTLYKYYPVKEAILSDFVGMTFEKRNDGRIEKLKKMDSLKDRVLYYLKDLMEGVMREPVIFEKFIIYVMKNLVSHGHDNNQSSGLSEPVSYIIKSGYEEGSIDKSFPPELVIDFFIFSFVELTKFYYRNPEEFKLKETVEICAKLFINGVTRR